MPVSFYEIAAGSWWEPGTPMMLDIGDLSAILGFFLLLGGALLGLSRFWLKALRRIIKEEIEIATEPIHPNSNGGLSLADVARKTDQMQKDFADLHIYNQETRDILLSVLSSSSAPTQSVEPKKTKVRKMAVVKNPSK